MAPITTTGCESPQSQREEVRTFAPERYYVVILFPFEQDTAALTVSIAIHK